MTDDLAAFIAARLDEDEVAAKAATQGDWHWVDPGVKTKLALVSGGYSVEDAARWDNSEWGWNYVVRSLDDRPQIADTEHIARHDPARVLREVAAMRAILAEHQPEEITDKWTVCYRCADWEPGTFYGDEEEGEWPEDSQGRMSWPCPTLLRLAYIWSDHPGYRAEWKRAHINYRAEWKP